MFIACVDRLDEKILVKAKDADILELRDDLVDLNSPINWKKFLLVTFKKNKDKKFIFSILEKIKPEYVDIEYFEEDIFLFIRKNFPKIKIIVSYHNFLETPKDLDKILSSIKIKGDFYKIACFANSSIDSLRMLHFLKDKKNVCGICMGKLGEFSRILSFFYSPFSYVKIENPVENFQLSLLDMKYRYFFNKKNRIYAVIGDVEKSPSHIIHNKIFSLINADAVYVKIFLKKEELPLFFYWIKELPIYGISVTMPLKKIVGDFIEKPPFPCNTLFLKNKKWEGYNTDAKAALFCIEKRIFLKGKNVFIIGTGGVGTTVALELFKKGAKISIFNRTLKKAKLLAKKCGGRGYSLEDMEKKLFQCDLLINGTCLDFQRRWEKFLKKEMVVMDFVIQDTLFLKSAKKRGCRVIHGLEIFVYQAKEQLKIWGF